MNPLNHKTSGYGLDFRKLDSYSKKLRNGLRMEIEKEWSSMRSNRRIKIARFLTKNVF
ncbi:hypothetical protein AB3N59_06795 [Leptospira sp. WS92.C1]